MSRWRDKTTSDNSQRWMVSYADFITLLFAFFVVMYSISQVNESKYKVLSDSVTKAFINKLSNQETYSAAATDSPGLVDGPVDRGEGVIENAGSSIEAISLPRATGPTEREKREFAQIYQQLAKSLQPLVDKKLVEIRANQDWIEIDMRSGLLFESGSDVLGNPALPVLEEIASQLQNSENLMRIRGYTDNQMINTERFPSNWELASARAVAVVRKLQQAGIGPDRMAVEGFGEFNPIASNDFEEGRARNRRVVLAVSRFHKLSDQQPGVISPANPAANTESNSLNVDSTSVNGNAAVPTESEAGDVEIVRLPNGGLLIRGKEERSPTDEQRTPPNP